MPQLFPPRADIVLRTAVVGVAAFLCATSVAVWAFARTPAATGQYQTSEQPIPFAHGLHVSGLKIDCRYCHAGAERAAMAGLPPTSACVPCHFDATIASNLFAPIRQSISTGRPIPWVRITRVPDFVYFNHAVHVQNGVGCDTCHGPVESMQQVYQAAPLTMEWCVGCHRSPERYMAVKSTGVGGWVGPDVARSRELAARFDVDRLTSCTTCHR